MLTSRLCLGLPNDLFPSAFPTKIFHTFLISNMRATLPAHLILNLVTLIIFGGKVYKLRSSSLRNFIQPSATSSLLGSNMLPSTLFFNTLNLFFP